MTAVAPAQSFELISCERGLGRMLPQACARRHQLGNGSPSSIPAAVRMQAAGIRYSPCRACPHGERRAAGKSVAGEQLVTVRPAGDPAGASQHGSKSRVVAEQSRERALQLQSRPLVSEAEAVLLAPQHARARVEIDKRLTKSTTTAPATASEKAATPVVAKPAATALQQPQAAPASSGRGRSNLVCEICGQSFSAMGQRGPLPKSCVPCRAARASTRPARPPAATAPASSRQAWPTCSECSTTFKPYANKLTCSPACSDARNSRLTNERQKAKQGAQEPPLARGTTPLQAVDRNAETPSLPTSSLFAAANEAEKPEEVDLPEGVIAGLPTDREPAVIEPFAYTVRVRGLPVRCRALEDVVALVALFGTRA